MMADEHPQIEAYGATHYGGSPITLMFYTDDCDAMYAKALAAGAKSVREPADQSYGSRMAGVLDPFGYKWWVGTQIKNMSVTEIEEAVSTAQGTV
jgi:PhnB protein